MEKTFLFKSITRIIAITAIATWMPAIPALAQDNTTPAKEGLVMDSRIAQDPVSATGPTTLPSTEDTVEKLIDKLRSMKVDINGSNNDNESLVNLRNLASIPGALITVNGRRFVPSTSSASSAENMNTIPANMIERIEVLTDKTSIPEVAQLDTIVVVFNINTKDSFDGLRTPK